MRGGRHISGPPPWHSNMSAISQEATLGESEYYLRQRPEALLSVGSDASDNMSGVGSHSRCVFLST